MALRLLAALALACLPPALGAAERREAALAAANPIRKVVTLLQSMQKKVAEEGEKEKELYSKFMCYCKSSGGTLKESIAAAEGKVPAVGSDIKESEEQKAQLQSDLKQAQVDRSAAKDAMAKATALREKEATAYSAEKADYDANIAAIAKAVSALKTGMGSAFLQTGEAALLKSILLSKQASLADVDRQDVLAFLSGGQGAGYAPQSGQIVGILEEMGDEMAKSLKEATSTEDGSFKAYEELIAAKKKEVSVLGAAIESKLGRTGELGVAIEHMKSDLSDTQEALLADKEFLANLESGCSTKTAEWDERVKTRAEELLALAETIKIINDDDALDLFKKTLPSAAASLVQVQVSADAVRKRALLQLGAARGAARTDRVRLDLISLALHGKKMGFDKVIGMIDGMVKTLKTEQDDDDHKKEYCSKQFDIADDKKKALERSVSDAEAAMESAEEGIATLKDEIAALEAGIKSLDASVAEATAQRKSENKDFTELMVADTAAKDLLSFAKNRLNQFYNPKLYKPPAKRELSREDRIAVNFGGTAPPTPAPGGIAGTGIAVLAQVSAHSQQLVAPPPPPATFGAYAKKSEEGSGVVAMIDLLVKDLDKEMTEAETEEKDSQADYEAMMKDSTAKRVADSKLLTEKQGAKADLEGDLESHKGAKASAGKELMAALKYIQSLHSECDWLLQYFDVRKEARASEVDSLLKAKAVLAGADFSLLQTKSRGFLRKP